MQRILLKRIKADLRNAFLAKEDGDEWVLQTAAYHVQQAIEKCLKQVYTEYGKDYKHTHELGSLSHNLPVEQILISQESLEKLEDALDSLEKWESSTRYDDPYIVSKRRVDTLYSFAEQLYAELLTGIEMLDQKAKETSVAQFKDKPTLKKLNLE